MYVYIYVSRKSSQKERMKKDGKKAREKSEGEKISGENTSGKSGEEAVKIKEWKKEYIYIMM